MVNVFLNQSLGEWLRIFEEYLAVAGLMLGTGLGLGTGLALGTRLVLGTG